MDIILMYLFDIGAYLHGPCSMIMLEVRDCESIKSVT